MGAFRDVRNKHLNSKNSRRIIADLGGISGVGYLYNDEFFEIPAGAQLVVEAPPPPLARLDKPAAESPLLRSARAQYSGWRNIGLGKRSPAQKSRSFAMIGLG